MGLSLPIVPLTQSSPSQVLYCPFIPKAVSHWEWIMVSWWCSICQSLYCMWDHRGEKGASREEKLFLFSSLPTPSSSHVHKHFRRAAVCVYAQFCVFVCVCGFCMKDWCWPKYLPSCIRPGTHWARERGGEKVGGRGRERRSRCHR